jgi:hypothetical protein
MPEMTPAEAATTALAATPGSVAETNAIAHLIRQLRGPMRTRVMGDDYIMLSALFTYREEEGWLRARDLPIANWTTLESLCTSIIGSKPVSMPRREVLIRALEIAAEQQKVAPVHP